MVLGLSVELVSSVIRYLNFLFKFYIADLDVDYCLENALHLTLSFITFFQVHGMLSQMDPALAAYCDKIASQGGPAHLPDELGDTTFPATPVVQLATTTRTSARLRHVQPEVNLDQGYEVLKRTKKVGDGINAGMAFGI